MAAEPAAASLAEMLARTARRQPDRPAITCDGRTWTFTELWDGARTAAFGLQRAGVGAGDAVMLALPNGAEFFLAFFATLICGGIAVPVFPRSTADRLGALARLAGAAAVVASDSLPPDVLAALSASSARDGRTFLSVADLGRSGTPAHAPDDPDRPCYIQYTSGSTADPRGAVITHGGLLANIGQMTGAMDITAEDVFVSWLPTYHDMGLTLMALTPFSLGAHAVLLPTDLRNVQAWLQAIEAHRGTFTAGPDFAYRLCLRNIRQPGRFDVSSLQVCMNASEPVRPATLTGFEEAFGLRNVMMAGYGLAEATLSVTCTGRGEAIDIDERGLVCLGLPMDGTSVRIAGPRELPAGQTGEIVVAGPSICAGYHLNPAATAALSWPDADEASAGPGPYIRTGDLGYLDSGGRLFFVARTKDVLNLAGRSLYPQEVESVVDEVRGVRLSAAVGIDRGRLEGEQLYIFAEIRDPDAASAVDLRALAMEIVRSVHGALGIRPRGTLLLRPRRIPVTSNGKLRRVALREAYADGRLEPGTDIIFPPPLRAAGSA